MKTYQIWIEGELHQDGLTAAQANRLFWKYQKEGWEVEMKKVA